MRGHAPFRLRRAHAALLAGVALLGAPAAAAAVPSPTVIERGAGGRGGAPALRLERIAGGALLTYANRSGLRATVYANGRWSPPEPAGGHSRSYRLVTADSAGTAAIVIEGSGEPVSVRYREAGGRFVANNPPLLPSGEGAVDPNALGMGGDGALYAMVRVREYEEGSDRSVLRLRVLVRSPGAGWSIVPDVARIVERGVSARELQPVLATAAGSGDVLLAWARSVPNGPTVLEGAIGGAGGFGAPVQLIADVSDLVDEEYAATDFGDARVVGGQLILTAHTGSFRSGSWGLWSGPLTGPLTKGEIPFAAESPRIGADGSVIAVAGTSTARSATLTVGVRAPDGAWAVRTNRVRQPGLGVGFASPGALRGTTFDTLGGRSAVSWGVTCPACGYFGVAQPITSGVPRLPVLLGVSEECPPIPVPGSSCGPFGSGPATFQGPLWLHGADATDDNTDVGPLVTMVDGRPLAAWAAVRWTGRGQKVEDVVLASHDPAETAPPARISSFQTSVGPRRCGLGSCTRVITVRVNVTAPAQVSLAGLPLVGATAPRFGRSVVVFRFKRVPGTYRIRPVVPGAPPVAARTVRVT